MKLDIRYGTLWVRMLCCVTVAVVIWRLVDLVALRKIERVVYMLLLDIDARTYKSAADWIKTSLVFFLCLSPAITRIERPIMLLLTAPIF
ncbi:MAG: hypothetical protein AAF492_20140 [Verrucomicrobiota bacterium]